MLVCNQSYLSCIPQVKDKTKGLDLVLLQLKEDPVLLNGPLTWEAVVSFFAAKHNVAGALALGASHYLCHGPCTTAKPAVGTSL